MPSEMRAGTTPQPPMPSDAEVAAVERERCARIAEDATIGWNHDYDNGCADVARRIREGEH